MLTLSLLCAYIPLIAMDNPEQIKVEHNPQASSLTEKLWNIWDSQLVKNLVQVVNRSAKQVEPVMQVLALLSLQPSFSTHPVELCKFLKKYDISDQEPEVRLKEAEKEEDDGTIIATNTAVIDHKPFAATTFFSTERAMQIGWFARDVILPTALATTGNPELFCLAFLAEQGGILGSKGIGHLTNTIQPVASLVSIIKTSSNHTPQLSSDNYAGNRHAQDNHQDSDKIFISMSPQTEPVQSNNNQTESNPLTLIKEGGKAAIAVATVLKEGVKFAKAATTVVEQSTVLVNTLKPADKSANAQPLNFKQQKALSNESTKQIESIAIAVGNGATACQHLSEGLQSIERTLNSPAAISHGGKTVAQATILTALGLGGAKLVYNKLSKDKVDKNDAIIAGIGASTTLISLLLAWHIMQAPNNNLNI